MHSLRHIASVSALPLLLVGCPSTNSLDTGASSLEVGVVDAGGDAPSAPDAPIVDAFYMPSCEPMQAETNLCFAGDCAGPSGAYWDGAACVESHCDCIGPECGIYATKAACDAAHTMCEAALCANTGGAWFRVPAWCGHFECGQPNPAFCETPTTACDCGPRRNFEAGVGCVAATCPIAEMVPPETLCAATGGTWRTDICGHATCGRLSDLECVSPGCVCDQNETFDAARGCIPDPVCEVRVLGESCTETGLCGEGSTCCANGGASAASTCVEPMCASSAGICGLPRP